MKLAREMYFAILLDRSSAGPVMIGCSEGGTSIEDLAEKFPEKIVKVRQDTSGQRLADQMSHCWAGAMRAGSHMRIAWLCLTSTCSNQAWHALMHMYRN